MWFWIWCVLVVAALTGAFVLGRDLWRKAGAVTGAVDGLFSARADATVRAEERIEATVASVPRGPDVFRERRELVEIVAQRRAVRRARVADRRARHAPRYAAWRDLDR